MIERLAGCDPTNSSFKLQGQSQEFIPEIPTHGLSGNSYKAVDQRGLVS